MDINVNVYIDEMSAQSFTRETDTLDDILVLHIENGCDFFVSLKGVFDMSSYVIGDRDVKY